MPIRPENRHRYPADWPQISHEIRFVRAGGRCECVGECGRGTHTGRCPNVHGGAAYGTGSRVVLTTAHLDHIPEHCDGDNLRAMCQGCHLHYDKDHHAATAAATRQAARTAGMDPLFTLEGVLVARSEARVYTAIWDDPDFLALSMADQWMYFFLLSQADLEYTGVLAVRVRRWARRANRHPEELYASLRNLQVAGFVVVDEDSEELLVRSFIRRDEVYRQPNLMKSVVRGLVAVESPVIRAVIWSELQRIEADHADRIPNGSRAPIADAMASLNPSPYPPNGQREVTEKGIREPFREGFAEGVSEPLGLGSGEGEGVGELTLRTSKASSSSETKFPTQDDEANDTTADDDTIDEPVRDDVEALCTRLADWVVKNGSKPPTVGKRWRDAARRLIDIDGHPLDKALALIDWCQTDEFWQANVLSMPKFREKYDTLRGRATAQWKRERGQASNRFDLPASSAPQRIPASEKCEHLKRAATCGLCRAEREGAKT